MKKLLNLVLVLSVVYWPSICLAEIKRVDSMQQVLEIFKNIKGDSLGVFDIDMVLIQPNKPAFQMMNLKKHKTIFKELFLDLSAVEKNLALSLSVKEGQMELVEAKTPKIIKKINNHAAKLIALTACVSGSLGDIPNMTKLRYQQLKSVGIDFSKSFSRVDSFEFSNMQDNLGSYPQFYQGVIASNAINKGLVLIEFLNRVHYIPNTIVFVDDQEKNVLEVEKALTDFNKNIKYVGVVYEGADKFKSKTVSAEEFRSSWSPIIAETKRKGA